MKLILASASPRRLTLLREANVHPEVRPTDCDETTDPSLSPSQTVETLAVRKVRAAAELCGDKPYILAADTVVAAAQGGRIVSGVCETAVIFRELSDKDIDDYVSSGESDGKAGAYAIQETGDRFVIGIEGPWDNIVGLPIELSDKLLCDLGAPLRDFE